MTKLIERDPNQYHRSVLEMTRDLLDEDPGFVDELAQLLHQRQLVKSLAVVRARAGLSQSEIAEKMGCSQSKISKLENGHDANVVFGDFIQFIRAANYKARIFLIPLQSSLADEVEFHATWIRELLARMVSLAESEHDITKGVAAFIEAAALSLSTITRMAKNALPKLPTLANEMGYEVGSPEREEISSQQFRNSRRSPVTKLETGSV